MEDKIYNGPLPSIMTFLSDLPKFSPGDKVRFLGCVTKYSRKVAPATLTLVHDYPQGNGLEVLVDVDLLLTTLKSNDTQVGEWVHVIGYITSKQQAVSSRSGETRAAQILVQAIVLWSACPLKLDRYEKCLDERNTYDRE